MARSAPLAVIFRRGPSEWVQVLKWQTDSDRFEAGQWFKGRIYDRRSDLSPDGSLLIYFAHKINRRTIADSEYTYAWTAISRPPYLTALALWPKGNCWHGGGLFLGAKRVWLNHRPEVAVPHPKHRPKGLEIVPNLEACGEDWPVWSRRMKRDGWVLVQDGEFIPTRNGWRTGRSEVWERRNRVNQILLKRSTGAITFERPGGPYLESFRLVLETGEELHMPNVRWADWDQAGRLVFARAGKIFAGKVEKGRINERELIDLNDHKPTPLKAPDFARQW